MRKGGNESRLSQFEGAQATAHVHTTSAWPTWL